MSVSWFEYVCWCWKCATRDPVAKNRYRTIWAATTLLGNAQMI